MSVMSAVVEYPGLSDVVSGYSTLNNALRIVEELRGFAGLEVEPVLYELLKASGVDAAVPVEEALLLREKGEVPVGCHLIQCSFVAVAVVRGIDAAVRHLGVLVNGYEMDERVRELTDWQAGRVNRVSDGCMALVPYLVAIGCQRVGERVVPEPVVEDEVVEPVEYVNRRFD